MSLIRWISLDWVTSAMLYYNPCAIVLVWCCKWLLSLWVLKSWHSPCYASWRHKIPVEGPWSLWTSQILPSPTHLWTLKSWGVLWVFILSYKNDLISEFSYNCQDEIFIHLWYLMTIKTKWTDKNSVPFLAVV